MRSSVEIVEQETFGLVNVIAAPAALCDGAGYFLASNPQFEAQFGTGASVTGGHVKDVWDAGKGDELGQFLAQLGRGDDTHPQISCTDLTLRPFQTMAGARLLVQAVAEKADDPLLRFFLSQVDQAYWEFNVLEGRFTVSDSWRQMRGHHLEEDINNLDHDWLEEVHPDDVEHLRESVAAQVNGQVKSIKIQYRRRHMQTNQWLWLMCRATVVEYDAHGAPLRIVGIDNDISDIKQGEADLEQLNEKIQLAIDASGIGIWEFDSNKKEVHWDDRLLAIYGLEPGNNDQTGEMWAQCIHPDDRDTTVAFAEECARTKADLICDFRIVRPSGEIRHIRTMARYLDPSAKHTKLFGVNIDVTADVLHAQELERARKQLEFESKHDALTGLANRRLLDEKLGSLAKTVQPDQDICVMQLDLDHFKDINDTLGHAAGDAVLVHVAQVLERLIGESGHIFRMGGDEFSVLFEQAPSTEQLREVARAIIQTLKVPVDFEGQSCRFGVSIGAAQARGLAGLNANIFAKADIALYAAKRAGRSCFQMYSARTHQAMDTQLKRRQDLSDALAEGTIRMWYQPQYDATSRQMVGAEALVRIDHPRLGVLMPQDFLPLAADTGLLPQVEDAILQCVLDDQTQWASAGLDYPRVSINISAERLASATMLEQIKVNIADHHAIAFELLETAFVDDPEDIVLFNLDQLRSFDIPIELDDFGSGHASILALLSIRPNTVKIDRQLVKDIPWSEQAVGILRAIIALAREVNVRITLEGIETKPHLDAAATLDCDVLQGFGLCRPQNRDDFSAMLAAHAEVNMQAVPQRADR